MGKLRCLKFFFMLLLFSGISQITFAQPGDPPPPVPISGIEWLLVAGGILGAKKVFQKFKKRS